MNIKGIKIELPREPHYSTRILGLIFITISGDCKCPSHWAPVLTFFLKIRAFWISKGDRHSLVLFLWLHLSISLFICVLDRISLDLVGQQDEGREEDKCLHGWESPGGLVSRSPMCGIGRGCYPQVPLDVPLSSRLPSWCCFVCSVTPPLPLIMMKGPCYLTLFPICLSIYLSVVMEEKSWALPNLISSWNKAFLWSGLEACTSQEVWIRPWPGRLES